MLKWIAAIIFIPVIFLVTYYRLQKRNENTVIVLVLGDLGHSPRITGHARSLLRNRFKVHLVGYSISKIPQDLQENHNCVVHQLAVPVALGKRVFVMFLLLGVFRLAWQTLELLIILFAIPRPGWLLVQNPPAIPTLLVAQIYKIIAGTKLMIDWHNFGFSVLELQKGRMFSIPFKIYERCFGVIADVHVTVSEAMKEVLCRWQVFGNIEVFYDRPSRQFKSMVIPEKIKFLQHVNFSSRNISISKEPLNNAFTRGSEWNENRPILVVSSTSWTADEDFHVLFAALESYDNCQEVMPDLYVIITGKGPLQKYFEDLYLKMNLRKSKLFFAWLGFEDYAKLLSCADFGVSLHTSSSGLDLPMKIVDMLGSGIPVFAFDFHCICELVIHEETGYIFRDADSLAELIVKHLKKVDRDLIFKKSIEKFQSKGWEDAWDEIILPLLKLKMKTG